MASISLQEAQIKLIDLIHQLSPGEEVVVTENDQPLARIVRESQSTKTRTLGTLKGTVLFMADDFDAPLEDFREYME